MASARFQALGSPATYPTKGERAQTAGFTDWSAQSSPWRNTHWPERGTRKKMLDTSMMPPGYVIVSRTCRPYRLTNRPIDKPKWRLMRRTSRCDNGRSDRSDRQHSPHLVHPKRTPRSKAGIRARPLVDDAQARDVLHVRGHGVARQRPDYCPVLVGEGRLRTTRERHRAAALGSEGGHQYAGIESMALRSLRSKAHLGRRIRGGEAGGAALLAEGGLL